MEKKHLMKRRILTFSLVLSMVLSLIPAAPFYTEVKAAGSRWQIVEDVIAEAEVAEGGELHAVYQVKGAVPVKDGETHAGDVLVDAVLPDDDEILDAEEEIPYYLRDDYDGYMECDWEDDVHGADPLLSYREAREMLVDNPFRPEKGRITDGYDETIPSAYPAEYSNSGALTEYLKKELPPLRDQGDEGCCWAMSSLSLIENYIYTNGKKDMNGNVSLKATELLPGINYSELQLAYFFYHNNDIANLKTDHVQDCDHTTLSGSERFTSLGGNRLYAAEILLNGIGAVDEILVPYSTAGQFVTAEQMKAESGVDIEFMYNNDVAHLTNAYMISFSKNPNQVKQAIRENHAVGASFYSNSNYYNSENNAFYNYNNTKTNHAVSIVGWDDNFPKESFSGKNGKGTTIPSSDGAWLVRNSWMDTLSDPYSEVLDYSGYFWMSYEDRSLNDAAYVFEAGMSDDYDNNYSYTSNVHSYGSIGWSKVANVFEINGEKDALREKITAAVIFMPEFYSDEPNVSYSISLYSVDENGFPKEQITAGYQPTTGTIVYPGIYTIPLIQPVILDRGAKFAVVLESNNGTFFEMGTKIDDSFLSIVGKNEKESFIYDEEDNVWIDFADPNLSNYFDDYGNICIQALTEDVGEETYPAVEGLRVTGRTDDSISLTWNEYAHAAYYAVFRANGEAEAYSSVNNYELIAVIPAVGSPSGESLPVSYGAGTVTYADGGLPANSHCGYYVCALDSAGYPIGSSSRFIAAELKPKDDSSMVTTVINANAGLSSGIECAYGTLAEGADGYLVKYKKEGATEWSEGGTSIINIGGTKRWVFDKKGLELGKYSFTVTPYRTNLYGERIYGSTTAVGSFWVRYPAPGNIRAAYNSLTNEITLTWDEVEGAPKYFSIHNIDTAGSSTIIKIGETDACSFTTGKVRRKDGESAVYEDIQPNRNYTFRVYVYDKGISESVTDYSIKGEVKVNTSVKGTLSAAQFYASAPGGIYNGSAYGALVSAGSGVNSASGEIGNITVYYAPQASSVSGENIVWNNEAPRNAGDYIYAIDVEEGTAYEAAEKLSDQDWVFSIAKADITVTPDDNQEKEEDDEDAALAYTWVSAVSGEVPGFTGTLSRVSGETTGTYDILPGTLALADNSPAGKEAFRASNYEMVFASGKVFTINPVSSLSGLTVAAVPAKHSVTLSWNDVPKARGYAVFSGSGETPLYSDAGLSYTAESLEPGKDYTFTVYPYRDAGNKKQYLDDSRSVDVRTDDLEILEADNFSFSSGSSPLTYDKKAHGAVVIPVDGINGVDEDDITIYYKKSSAGSESGTGSGSAEWTETVPVNAGTYQVAIDVAVTDEFAAASKLTDASWNYTINQKEVGLVWGGTVFEYDGNPHIPTVTLTGILEGDICTSSISGEATAAGSSNIAVVTGISNPNYKLPEDHSVSFTITMTQAGFTALPKAKPGLVFSGSGQELFTKGDTEDGTIYYALGENDTAAPSSGYGTDVIKGIDAKTYYIWYKVIGDSNHYGTEPVCVKAEIARKSIEQAEVTLSNTELVYDGTEQAVSVSGVSISGISLKKDTDYTVSGNSGQNVADYTVTVTGKGNYAGEVTAMWSITFRAISASGEDVSVAYDGEAHGIDVKVSDPAEGAKVLYGLKEGVYDKTESPAITYVAEGTLKVYYQITADNYLTKTGYTTVSVIKADQDAPAAPEVEKVLATSITLKAVNGYEYRMNGGEWKSGNVFTGLEQGKEYSFCQRIASDANHNASESSPENKVITKIHAHVWDYSAEGEVLTATCKNTDEGHIGELTSSLTIAKPQHEVYGDGKPEQASVSGSIEGLKIPDIVYKKGNVSLSAAPVDAGTYTANITIGAATACVEYIVEKASASINVARESVEKTMGEEPFELEGITKSETDAELVFTVTSGSDVIALTGNLISLLKPGTGVITVSLPEGKNYKAAESKIITIIVSEASEPNQESGSGEGTTSGSGEGTTSGSGEGTTSESGEETTSESGEGTTSGSGEGTTSESGEGTTSESGEGTTSGSGEGTTSGSGEGSTSESGEGTTSESGEETTSESGEGTTSESGEGTTSGSGEGTTSGSGEGTSESGEGTTSESGEGTSESGEGTTSGSGEGTTSGSGEGTTSESGEGTTSESGEGTTSESGEGTTSESGSGTTSESGSGTGEGTNPGSGTGEGTTSEPGEGTTSESGSGTTPSSGTGEGTTSESGSGTNSESEKIKYGDVDGDGNIGAKDVTMLRRYLAGGWGVTIRNANADVNADGVINAKDVTMLRRYLAGGWGVVLGKTV